MPETSLTIRVSRSTHELLRELANRSNTTITSLVDEAVRELQRKKFWDEFNAACQSAQADPEAWGDLQRQNSAWEATLTDGLVEETRSHEQSKRRGKSRSR